MGKFNLPLFLLVILLAGIIAIPLIIWTNLATWMIIPLAPIISFIVLLLFSLIVDFFDVDKQITSQPSQAHIFSSDFLRSKRAGGLLCPKCSSDQIMEIIYGLPPITEELQKELDKKTITLGGCMVEEDSPRWACDVCHCRFQSPPINKNQAFQLINHIIKDIDVLDVEGDELIIIESETIEKDWGWVFFYSSKKWIETNDFEYAVAGNAPYFVLRDNGKILETGTAYPVDHYIKRFEATGNPNG